MIKKKSFIDINGYHIKKKYLDNDEYEKIKDELTVIPFRLDAYTDEEKEKAKNLLFNEKKKYITIPKYYGIFKYGKCKDEYCPEEISLSFNKTLRDKQKFVVEKCIEHIKKFGGGLLSVPCGFGKTVCAIYISAILGLKTLIVVHKTFLLDQWYQRIIEFLDIDPNKIGIIKQKKCEYENKDIVIGTIHTIAKKEYDIYHNFGFVIYDEAHHVCAKFFSKALRKLNCKYTLALTATPYRGDGLIKVMHWFCGGTIYQEKIKINKHVVVKVINYKCDDELFKLVNKWNYRKKEKSCDTNITISNITKIDCRNDIIINLIDNIVKLNKNRKILVLSDRIDHLHYLKETVDDTLEEKINTCYYIGKCKRSEREFAEDNGDIIYASYSMAHEGLDIKHLNTVILASPRKDVVQSIGRIMRKILIAGDLKPLIIDIADEMDVIKNWSKVRYSHYKKCNYNIEDYFCKNEKFMTRIEYSNMKLKKTDYHVKNIKLNNQINKINKSINDNNLQLKKLNLVHSSDRIVYDDLEYTNINDILYTDKLNENDFEYVIEKNFDDEFDFDNIKDIFDDDFKNDIKPSVNLFKKFLKK